MIVMAGCPDDLSRKRLYSLATDLAGEHAANGCRQLGHDITVDVRLGMRIADAAIIGEKNVSGLGGSGDGTHEIFSARIDP